MDINVVWFVFGGVLTVLLLTSFCLVKFYTDPNASHPLSTFITMLSLVISLISVMLIPLDVLLTVRDFPGVDSSELKIVYLVMYSTLTGLAFLAIPFAYFYVEDYSGEDQLEEEFASTFSSSRHRNKEYCKRTCSSLKSTSVFIIIVFIIILVGLFFEPGEHQAFTEDLKGDAATRGKAVSSFVDTITNFNTGGGGERAIMLIIAVLSTIGCLNFIYYTGYGIVAFPINLFRGFRRVEDEQLGIEYERLQIRQARTMLQSKYQGASKKNKVKILRELNALEAKEVQLNRHTQALETMSNECSYRCYRICFPFRAIIGIALFLLSTGFIVCFGISALDRTLHSTCGFNCGFLLNTPKFYNPFDQLLVQLSYLFPLDYCLLGATCFYFLMCSLFGLIRLGIRIFGFQIFKIRRRRTWPQALLLCALSIIFSILGLAIELMILAPQYITFGSQTYNHEDGSNVACSFTSSSADGQCQITQISVFMHTITVSIPVFSIVFYFANWLFIAFAFACAIHQLCKTADSRFEQSGDMDSDDDLERELTNLQKRNAARLGSSRGSSRMDYQDLKAKYGRYRDDPSGGRTSCLDDELLNDSGFGGGMTTNDLLPPDLPGMNNSGW